MKRTALALIAAALTGLCASAQEFPYQDPSLTPRERAEDLISRLSMEQKASLMMNSSPAIPELGIRRYNWWNEALHGAARAGLATSFPQTIGMASSWDPELLEQVFDVASTEQRIKFVQGRGSDREDMRYHGLTVWTPNINIFRDPRWGRGQETYGEDPFLTSRMGEAVVKGLQGEPRDGYDKLHACLKHYAVHSGSESTRHTFDVEDLPYRDLRETYLYAFEYIVKHTDVQEVMCAYNRFEGKPCCGSDKLLTQILRNEWGYKGLVVSDCGAVDDFYEPWGHQIFPGDRVSSAALAVRSGTDLECGHKAYASLVQGVKEGKISEEEVDVSLRRLLVARFRLGEMDPLEMVSWNKVDSTLLDCPEHQALALKMGHEAIVLLQNDGILPLPKSAKYAVTGINAKSEKYPLGNYEGTPAHVTSPFEGICNAIGAGNVTENTDEADIVIYIGGINPDMEGEEMGGKPVEGFYKGDRTTIELPRAQREEITALHAAGKKVVFVNMSGGAVALEPETHNCCAILQAWYGGETAGTALADIIFGDVNPSGHLPVTFYRSDADLPDILDYRMENRTYRYFDGEPLWAFGHGLSYTKFKFRRARVKDGMLVVKVRNCGRRDGDDVVQMYVAKDEDTDGPKMALRGFKRVSVPARKTVTVCIPLDNDDVLAVYDGSAGRMVAGPGHYTVYYGDSSAPERLRKIRYTRQ